MSPSVAMRPLLNALAAVQLVLDAWSQQGVIIGGVAASLLGRPRYTADVDAVVLVSTQALSEFAAVTRRAGLMPRVPDAEAFARRHRVLLLRHAESGVDVDISLGALPFEEQAVARATVVQVSGLALRLVTPEDLIIMKAVAHRRQDMEDIQAVIERHPNLDRQRIRLWVQQFAEVLEAPELWTDIAGWLESKPAPRSRRKRV
ncbi:MAG: nucleotidyltransferase [Anaerolineae bacterium]|nr:nucleotidyltransferase [Anaerolineae bacterium]